MNLSDLLAAVAVVLNGLPQGLLALTYGFAAFPTALGFAVGTLGALVFSQVAPISFQAESIVLAGTMGRDRQERLNIVIFCGIVMAIIGGIGLLEPTIDFIGPAILNGMMAGVGVILATVAINMIKQDYIVGGVSSAAALLTYGWMKDLVYTIVISVFVSSVIWILLKKKNAEASFGAGVSSAEIPTETLKRTPWKINPNVIRGTLAMITLQIGGNIAYGSITGSIANTPVNVDHITLYSGVADTLSAMFGGGPVEAIISGTAAAPHPHVSAVLMMGMMTLILALKLLPRIARYVPSQSIAGFLFVLGAIVVFPTNIGLGLQADPVIAGVTAVVTAATDPFIGMVTGVALRFLM
ncbi:MAG TPA: NCS2 family permease [Clostridia bacterium]|nr:NCS2 family permease [Clostridia bacterium]